MLPYFFLIGHRGKMNPLDTGCCNQVDTVVARNENRFSYSKSFEAFLQSINVLFLKGDSWLTWYRGVILYNNLYLHISRYIHTWFLVIVRVYGKCIGWLYRNCCRLTHGGIGTIAAENGRDLQFYEKNAIYYIIVN